jgi:hypothetical protein
MPNRPDLYASLLVALGAMFAGVWLGRSEAVFLGLGMLMITSMLEQMRP